MIAKFPEYYRNLLMEELKDESDLYQALVETGNHKNIKCKFPINRIKDGKKFDKIMSLTEKVIEAILYNEIEHRDISLTVTRIDDHLIITTNEQEKN